MRIQYSPFPQPRRVSPGKNEFGDALKGQAWGIATNLTETSAMLISLRRSGTASERIVILIIVAVMRQCKSADWARSSVKRVACLLCFSLGRQSGEQVALTGETSMVLPLHDFLEGSASRRRTVSPTIRHPLNCRANAIQIQWPLDHSSICSAVPAESTTSPKHNPAMPLETAKLPEGVATNKEAAPLNGLLVMEYFLCRTPSCVSRAPRGSKHSKSTRIRYAAPFPGARQRNRTAMIGRWRVLGRE